MNYKAAMATMYKKPSALPLSASFLDMFPDEARRGCEAQGRSGWLCVLGATPS
jgi:hypothetical protein